MFVDNLAYASKRKQRRKIMSKNYDWTPTAKRKLLDLALKYPSLKELRKIYQKHFPHISTWSSFENALRRLLEIEIKNGSILLKSHPNQRANGLLISEERLFDLIKKRPKNLRDVCQEFGLSSNDIYGIVDSMRAKGYEITIEKTLGENKKSFFQVKKIIGPVRTRGTYLDPISRNKIKILVVSDTCFGYQTHQPELFATALEIGSRENVDIMIHSGNIIAGRSNKNTLQDFWSDNYFEQLDYYLQSQEVPFKCYFMNGPRDLSFKTKKHPRNPARNLANQRENFFYAGDLEHDFWFGDLKIKAVHIKDQVTYSKSYAAQGIGENFTEAVEYVFRKPRKPDLLLVGGVLSYIDLPPKKPGGMQIIGLPSLYAMTVSQKSRKKRGGSPELGFAIIEIKLDKDGHPTNIESIWYPLTAYQRSRHSCENIQTGKNIPNDDENKILRLIKERPHRYGELSRKTGKSKPTIKKIVQALRKKGFPFEYDSLTGSLSLFYDWRKRPFQSIETDRLFYNRLKLMVFSDTHIGNQDARNDLIPEVYRIAEEEMCDIIACCGDIFDGSGAYRGHENELIFHGADDQFDEGIRIWPKSKIPTIMIAGSSHEWVFWNRSGYNIVKRFSESMDNIEYIGGREGLYGEKTINNIRLALYHPKGGVPYAKSYRPQKWIEGYVENISIDFPINLLLIGHLHISAGMLYKGIASILVPCLEDQTWYLKSKGLIPWLGAWVLEVKTDQKRNITFLKLKYISFEK